MNPAMDPLKKSRMIRVVRQYVEDGWLNKSALSGITNATEGDLNALLERGRARKEQSEGGGQPRPTQPEQPEPSAQEPAAESGEAPPATEGAEPVSEENQVSEQEFFDKFPKGTHLMYSGTEYIVIGHVHAQGGLSAHLETIQIEEGTTFSLQEFHDGEFEAAEEPRKVPQITEYPPQVFLLARKHESAVLPQVYLTHADLQAEHPDIDGDTIMEAISDPGEPQSLDGGEGTLVYTSIGK